MGQIMLTEKDGELWISTPYSREFVSTLKERIGTKRFDWDSKCWIVPVEERDTVLDILYNVYGYTEDGNTVTVTVKAKTLLEEDKGSVYLVHKPVARAYGRDSGAKPMKDVTLIEGTFTSGGSVKNWTTKVKEGATFKIRNFPELDVDKIDTDQFEIISTEKEEEKSKYSKYSKEELVKMMEEIQAELDSRE